MTNCNTYVTVEFKGLRLKIIHRMVLCTSYLKMGKEKNKSKLEDASILPACTKTNVTFSFLLLNVKEESLHIFWLRPDPHRNRILRWYRGPLLQLSIYF